MKTKYLTFVLVVLACTVQAQLITRGTDAGEIYLTRNWYMNNQGEIVWAVFRSIDNGQNLSLQYSSTVMPEQSTRLEIISDATPGVLYGYANDSLFISTNYGHNWVGVEKCIYENLGKYFSGNTPGRIYKTIVNQNLRRIELHFSENYGQGFTLLKDTIPTYYGEVCTEENSLYFSRYPYLGSFYKLFYSNDNGQNINLQTELDTTIAGYSISGQNTIISRGAVAGELYLLSWHTPVHYKIFYSNDYGQTFEFKYQSEYCNLYWWGFHFTAGREPGSFYVMRNTGTDSPYFHAQIYIDYSSDYGETFTTYFHDLDSSYIFANIELMEQDLKVKTYPNPFRQHITFSLPPTAHYGTITLINSIGKTVFQSIYQTQEPSFNLSALPTGIYFYKIQTKDQVSYSGKVVKY